MADPRRSLKVAGGLWQTQIGAPDKSIDESEKAKVVAGLWRKQIGSAQGAGGAGVPMAQPIALPFANPQAPVPPAGRAGKGVGGVGVGTGTVLGGAGSGQLLWPSMPLSTLGGAELVYPGAGGIGRDGHDLETEIASVQRGVDVLGDLASVVGAGSGSSVVSVGADLAVPGMTGTIASLGLATSIDISNYVGFYRPCTWWLALAYQVARNRIQSNGELSPSERNKALANAATIYKQAQKQIKAFRA